MSLKRGEIEFQDGEHAPIRDSEKFTYFKKTKSYTQEFKPKFPEYRGSLPHHFFRPEDMIDDIALHGKIHFADVAIY